MIKVIALVRRRPDLSQEEFALRWTEEHTRLSVLLGMSPYRINVAWVPQDDGSTPAYDGTAEMYWSDVHSFRAALASPDGVLAGKDVEAFATSVELMVVDETVVVAHGIPK